MKSNLNVTESFLVKLKGEMVVASYWSKKIYIISTKTELIILITYRFSDIVLYYVIYWYEQLYNQEPSGSLICM